MKPDVKTWMTDELFHQLFSGQIESMTAFATQKLQLRGNIGKALKLDKILKKIRGSGYFILPQNSKFWEASEQNKSMIYTSQKKELFQSQCLKIAKKVSFKNIASEASNIYFQNFLARKFK